MKNLIGLFIAGALLISGCLEGPVGGSQVGAPENLLALSAGDAGASIIPSPQCWTGGGYVPCDSLCYADSDCARGSSCCGGRCMDTDNDVANCGACGTVCTVLLGTPVCELGRCGAMDEPVLSVLAVEEDEDLDLVGSGASAAPDFCGGIICALGESCCSGVCVNTATDTDHCGACGAVCDLPHADAVCVAGSCEVLSCDLTNYGWPLYYDCADDGPGCGTPRGTTNCGGCGITCGAGERCNGSTQCWCGTTQGRPGAGSACGEGYTCLSGECVPKELPIR